MYTHKFGKETLKIFQNGEKSKEEDEGNVKDKKWLDEIDERNLGDWYFQDKTNIKCVGRISFFLSLVDFLLFCECIWIYIYISNSSILLKLIWAGKTLHKLYGESFEV